MSYAITLPHGWRIEREELERYELRSNSRQVREVAFKAFGPSEGATPDVHVATVYAIYDVYWGEWAVRPGTMTSRYEPDEARARAAAMMMAADEAEARNR